MAKKDLKFFMRSAEPEVVTAPGPATFVDQGTVPVRDHEDQ